MKEKFLYIRTFGCQMNEHDSERMRLMLAALGYVATDDPRRADLVLFNTCTIRDKAHHKAISEIGRAASHKKSNPGMLIGVCGCAAQADGPSLFERYPHIDIIFGPDQIRSLPALIEKAKVDGRASALSLIDDADRYVFLGRWPTDDTDDAAPASAFVSIMKGCNSACSYCVVPSVRGREVCRPNREIMGEIDELCRRGTKEIVLLGQNVNSYGYPRNAAHRDSRTSFTDLLKMISNETDIRRIRFTSPHPKDVTDELISEYASDEKLCPHMHLPLQAGSDETLRRMRRGYTKGRYLEIASRLRAARKGMGLSTDIIVGFCGETAAEFDETVEVLKTIEFDSIFAFKYSPRKGTHAYENLRDDVGEAEKDARLASVLSIQAAITKKRNEALVGTRQEALVFGMDKLSGSLLSGRIADNRLVHFAGNPHMIGDIVPVVIKKANKNSLAAEVIR
jgi:tRNA-2-methylthio-N6-dimethylallyladenosine synthase